MGRVVVHIRMPCEICSDKVVRFTFDSNFANKRLKSLRIVGDFSH